MKDETKCGAEERKCRTYEVEVMAHESNSTEPQCEPRQVSSVKEDIGEDLATVKEETGKKWFCLATDLLNASSSADACENVLPLMTGCCATRKRSANPITLLM
ncbi:hypothetical protein KIN20_025453 [Parelaphostrongylus tenuis]|uniref:Uncharacterized protein n=1 Tax=Parelaphostrongylus tenuis TaxID=148309 RepID=A0AAD5QWY3_PARTN|nr:hypothetical protein KIN20_025453 [Parelaphostrongylus tenuis]